MLTRPLRAPATMTPGAPPPSRPRLQVVLFSGGRGSRALAQQLVGSERVDVTLVINGYDDGASTGEVRRFLGDCLGPSDFRKNASRVAAELQTSASLIALVDYRLPVDCDVATAVAALAALRQQPPETEGPAAEVRRLVDDSPPPAVEAIALRIDTFLAERARTGVPFDFSDCAIGNLVFAGCFLRAGRRFNDAVDDYGGLLGVPAGHLENVTDGTNAYLVAIDASGALVASEADIVSTRQGDRIREIFLVDRVLDPGDPALAGLDVDGLRAVLARYAARPAINPRVVERIRRADLIIYAPGTQHSSLFPSYLTPGVSEAIAGNLHAIKLLITNIQPDAEIVDVSAVDLIDRALFYLRDKGRLATPAPCLITHYLINDPASAGADAYVPLGAVESLEDPRLVRIGNYEDGVTGRHDASKVLAPFIASLLGPERELRVAVYLHDATSADKLTQSLLEMVRGGVAELPARLAAFHGGPPLDAAFVASLPFPVRPLADTEVAPALREGGFDYVVLFESSGMYRGEDVVGLVSQLVFLPLDAVWGSRRLSVNDVQEAMRLVYRRKWLLGTLSYFGSHLLSLLYLVRYGRYIYDSLSGVRAIRARFLADLHVEPGHKQANHQMLTALLRHRAEILETPVRFFPIGPHQTRRTTILDGLRAGVAILTGRGWGRLRARAPGTPAPRA
jgi:2-phospho-L-lactate transferase/gluconeogenesis factor (CofD/UPF0052 family)